MKTENLDLSISQIKNISSKLFVCPKSLVFTDLFMIINSSNSSHLKNSFSFIIGLYDFKNICTKSSSNSKFSFK